MIRPVVRGDVSLVPDHEYDPADLGMSEDEVRTYVVKGWATVETTDGGPIEQPRATEPEEEG
jgi:hypothetical protein